VKDYGDQDSTIANRGGFVSIIYDSTISGYFCFFESYLILEAIRKLELFGSGNETRTCDHFGVDADWSKQLWHTKWNRHLHGVRKASETTNSTTAVFLRCILRTSMLILIAPPYHRRRLYLIHTSYQPLPQITRLDYQQHMCTKYQPHPSLLLST